jgi:hypothetical protein
MFMSWATVERHYRHFLGRKAAEVEGNPAPRVLGIDEHFFTKKQGFATTLAKEPRASRKRLADVGETLASEPFEGVGAHRRRGAAWPSTPRVNSAGHTHCTAQSEEARGWLRCCSTFGRTFRKGCTAR